MIFWACVLIGGFFTWLAIRIGFFESLALLFNIVISVYVAIFLTPVIIEKFSAAGEMSCGNVLALVSVAIGTFLILYGITYIFLTSQFKVTFSKVFEIIFAGLIGFFTGFLVSSFAAFIIAASPLAQNSLVSKIGFNKDSLRDNISYICWFSDSVNRIVSLPDSEVTTGQIIDELLENARQKEQETTNQEAELNQSSDSNEPNESSH
jgi:signal transduction histidine kinase